MLARLARYGGRAAPRIAAVAGAAFGASPWPSLPEDDFDRQPLVDLDRWLFVADVRLDNRSEVAAALGIDATTLSDGDLLFRALLAWSESALDRISGDFAFALFDSVEGKLLLGRDPTGQRPLFYACGPGFAAFASMPNAIAASRGVTAELDFETLARALSDMPPRDDRSYFAHVKKVRPGEIVAISGSKVERREYWQPPFGSYERIGEQEYVDAYRSILDEAVRSRLRRRGGRVATHLSAGLDSGAVASAAARLAGSRNVIAFTSAPDAELEIVNPEGRFPDESGLAAEVASFVGIRHVVVREQGCSLAHLRSHAALYQEPFRNNVNAGWLARLALEAARGDCQVMLTGEAGNLTLNGGSLANLADFIADRQWKNWLRESRLALRRGGARWTGVLMNSFGHRLPHRVGAKLAQHYLGVIPRSEASFLRREAIDQFVRPALPLEHEVRSGDSYRDRIAVLKSYDFGNFNKGILAETGVDQRNPLLDRRAIEFSLKIPPEELFHDGRSRALARRALEGRLPDKIRTMNERGYQAAGWHKQVSKAELLQMIEEVESSAAARQLLDIGRLKRTADRWDRIDFDDPAQDLAITTFLSLALAGGLFMLEAERGFPGLL